MKKFSFILIMALAAMLLLCACGVGEAVQPVPAAAAEPTSTPAPPMTDTEKYAEVLAEYSGMGYCFRDVDGDGNKELLIGPMEGDSYEKQVISAMYTIQGYEIKEVFESSENDLYYLCENGSIDERQSGGTTNIVHSYYYFAGGELKLMSKLAYGPGEDRVCHWTLTEAGIPSQMEESAAMNYISTYESTYITPNYIAING